MVSGIGRDVPNEGIDAGHVALVVKAQTPENRVKFVVVQHLNHGSSIEGARLLDRLRPDLNDGVRVQRPALGLVSLRAELGDDRRGRFAGTCVGLDTKRTPSTAEPATRRKYSLFRVSLPTSWRS